jgi:hypothetical protein
MPSTDDGHVLREESKMLFGIRPDCIDINDGSELDDDDDDNDALELGCKVPVKARFKK